MSEAFDKGMEQINQLRAAIDRILVQNGCGDSVDFSITMPDDHSEHEEVTLSFWFDVLPSAMMSQDERDTHDAFMDIVQGFDPDADASKEDQEIKDILKDMRDYWEENE